MMQFKAIAICGMLVTGCAPDLPDFPVSDGRDISRPSLIDTQLMYQLYPAPLNSAQIAAIQDGIDTLAERAIAARARLQRQEGSLTTAQRRQLMQEIAAS